MKGYFSIRVDENGVVGDYSVAGTRDDHLKVLYKAGMSLIEQFDDVVANLNNERMSDGKLGMSIRIFLLMLASDYIENREKYLNYTLRKQEEKPE